MKVLILLSPPVNKGPIPQCIAIQAHQPDAVHLIQTLYPGQQPNNHQFEYINAWISGPNSLLSKYQLDEPYPVPFTSPLGYISSGHGKPTLHFHTVDVNGLAPKINELSNSLPPDSVCFDLLPGGKEAKLQSLLVSDERIKLTYSLENGKFIHLASGLVEEGSQLPLSLIDRFWLSGEPVYVEKSHAAIEDDSIFLTAIHDALSVELLTERKERELIARRTAEGRPGRVREHEFFDRPISTFNKDFRTAFKCHGINLQHPNDELDDVIFHFENGRIESFPEKKEGSPNGTVLEPVITNLLAMRWSLHDSLTGVSVIYPRPEDRIESYRNLTQKAYNNNQKHEKLNQFALRCEKVSLEWQDTTVEQLMEAEFEAIRNGVLSVDEALKFIRQVEMDTVCLVDSGVLSFDTKAFISDLKSGKKKQKAMQKPSSLFNNRSSGQYYVVCSTSPDQNLKHEPVIHMSQLANGPHVLYQHNKHLWLPSKSAIEDLRSQCINELGDFLKKKELLEPLKILAILSRGVGAAPQVLARLFCGDEHASALHLLKELVRSDEDLKRQLWEYLRRHNSNVFDEIERSLKNAILERKITEQAEKRKELQKRKLPHKDVLKKMKQKRKEVNKAILEIERNNENHTLEYMRMKTQLSAIDIEIFKIKSERQAIIEERERELRNLNPDSIEIELPPLPHDETLVSVVDGHLNNHNAESALLSVLIDQYLELNEILQDGQ